ncbi:hypothetical protein THAOC_23554, partial [Thalassiosira oceanica]
MTTPKSNPSNTIAQQSPANKESQWRPVEFLEPQDHSPGQNVTSHTAVLRSLAPVLPMHQFKCKRRPCGVDFSFTAGPPNAGKSTLFNRLMDKELNKSYRLGSDKKKTRSNGRISYRSPSKRSGGAIVTPVAGTTRDRRECIGRLGGVYFRMIDTAGVDGEKLDVAFGKRGARGGTFGKQVQREIVILANKLEGDRWATMNSEVMDNLAEVSRVGFGEPIPISAEHGEGMADLAVVIDQLTRKKRKSLGLAEEYNDFETEARKGKQDPAKRPLQLAILGRQNVGKK